jgi:hypothetical protein
LLKLQKRTKRGTKSKEAETGDEKNKFRNNNNKYQRKKQKQKQHHLLHFKKNKSEIYFQHCFICNPRIEKAKRNQYMYNTITK